ncbi:MAG: hypothetical protein NTU85_03520 [Candidatus Kaiserbacteria bacterium]|nr:hypothetical protein [Candidatus Kaiserbacteria bacterium]
MWVDIETSTGVRLGAGPITTATSWRSTRRLDGVGDFTTSLPWAEPRVGLIQVKRVARCFDFAGGTLLEVGAGIIQRRGGHAGSGAGTLEVSGADLLRELVQVRVGALELFETVIEHPSTALHLSGIFKHLLDSCSGPKTTLTLALDGAAGDTATWATTHIDDIAEAIEIRATHAFHGIQVRMGPQVNTHAGPDLTLTYWDVGKSDWVALSGVEDGTNAAAPDDDGLHLGQSGTISFTVPAEWVPAAGFYRLRIAGDDIGTGTAMNLDIADLAIIYETPTKNALAKIMALAPAGWSLDAVHGQLATTGEVYLQMANESILETLRRVAETTGEHLTGGYTGRELIWWGARQETAPLTAIGGGGFDGLAVEGNAAVCLIKDLSEVQDAFELYSQVTAVGGGTGDARVTLAETTEVLPAGYSLVGGTLIRDAAVAALGVIEYQLEAPDIVPTNVSGEQRTHAANTLFKQAAAWLAAHSATDTDPLTGDVPRAYTLAVVKADRLIWPNDLLRVVYHEVRDGVDVWDVDAVLTVVAATTECDADGVRTVSLEVATVQRPPEDGALAVVQAMQFGQQARSHGDTAVGAVLVGAASMDMGGLTDVLDPRYTAAGHALDTAASQHVGGVGDHSHQSAGAAGGLLTAYQAALTPAAAIADAVGGTPVDVEARAALNDLLAKLRTMGLLET